MVKQALHADVTYISSLCTVVCHTRHYDTNRWAVANATGHILTSALKRYVPESRRIEGSLFTSAIDVTLLWHSAGHRMVQHYEHTVEALSLRPRATAISTAPPPGTSLGSMATFLATPIASCRFLSTSFSTSCSHAVHQPDLLWRSLSARPANG